MVKVKFSHNKKRNSALVYEFLVRRISQTMIEGDKPGYAKALGIVRKYYGEDAPISQEKELFDVIRNTRGVSESSARTILAEVRNHAAKLDHKKIDIKKSNLIKEINYSFGRSFFDEHRVPEYRLLATVQMVIDASKEKQALSESVQQIQLEEGLVKYMTSTGELSLVTERREDVDQLVMAMAAKKFQEKYSSSLSGDQKVLLEKYIRATVTGDEKPLAEYMAAEKERIRIILSKAETMKEVLDDEVMRERLKEAKERFGGWGGSEQAIEEIMLYQKLVEEIQSDE